MRYTEPEEMAVCSHCSSLYPAHSLYKACLSARGHILTHVLFILMWSRSSDCIRLLGCWVFSWTKAFLLGYSLSAIHEWKARLYRAKEGSLQSSGVLTAPQEDLSSVPSTHIVWLMTVCNPSPEDGLPSSGCHGHPSTSGIYSYRHTHIKTNTPTVMFYHIL